MTSGPIRRAQLISPFGVGALVVVRDGTSLICAGLDHWFEHEPGASSGLVDKDEFIVEEWRLERELGVDHFCLPPDYRVYGGQKNTPNLFLTVPFLRFPQWHFCPSCRRLYPLPLTTRGRVKCTDCAEKRRKSYVAQVPLVAMCDDGHIQDFPWREWVHRTGSPSCNKPLRLIATGGASLGAMMVKCDCGEERSLAGITEADPGGEQTFLSTHLAKNEIFMCQGKMPWLGKDEPGHCSRPLRGSLRSASNLYFAQIRSSIYLPAGEKHALSDLTERLESPPISTFIRLLMASNKEVYPDLVRAKAIDNLQDYTDEQIADCLKVIQEGAASETGLAAESVIDGDDEGTAFRRAEFAALLTDRQDDQLSIRALPTDKYAGWFASHFSRIALVEKLRETRVFAGFSRVFADSGKTAEERKAMLWRQELPAQPSWLPAYKVYGEGIFLEFDETRLSEWEQRPDVVRRILPLTQRYRQAQQARRLRDRPLVARFVLLHTFAHLLMNQLTFECGYSSASLRERLYVSDNPLAPMAGVLIYTAAGDSEGTMGGLVRMGRPGILEPVVLRALEVAGWCSADPICMETGHRGGQGPDSCNLAACHNCALVPETACEEFNRFLDRGVVVGGIGCPRLGYFSN